MSSAKNQNQPKNSGGFGAGFLVATVIFLAVLMVAGLACGGWWYYKKYIERKAQPVGQQTQSPAATSIGSQNENLVYTNNQFGFSVAMTPAWKDYKAKAETMGGDMEVGKISFFLPTSQKNWMAEDMPGYFNAFTISAFVRDSWDEYKRTASEYAMMGEEIGRNNYYVFVWSHFNGDPPSDILAGTIRDMETIVKSIQTFAPAGTSAQGSSSAAPKATTKKDCSFPNGDIEYWWNTVSQSVRDCYIEKYGYPSF